MKTIEEFEKVLENTRKAINEAETKEVVSSIMSNYISETQNFTMDDNLTPIELDTSPSRRKCMDATERIRRNIAVNPNKKSLKELKETATGALIILNAYVRKVDNHMRKANK